MTRVRRGRLIHRMEPSVPITRSPAPPATRDIALDRFVFGWIGFALGIGVGIAATSLVLTHHVPLVNGVVSALTQLAPEQVLPSVAPTPSPDEVRAAILAGVNAQRQAVGVAPLVESPALDRSAEAKLKDMIAKNYWSHYSPTGDSPWDFIDAAGYRYQFAAENLARDYATADGVVQAWMNSPEHRANLLSPTYTETGLSVSFQGLGDDTGMLVVQHFGKPQ